jgi:excisionase family DNA binding protein
MPVLREVSASLLAVSLEQAAEMLSTSKRTIERERDRGKLKCLRLGRLWKVRVGELHAYLRKKEIEAAR